MTKERQRIELSKTIFVTYAFTDPQLYRYYMDEWCGIGDWTDDEAIVSIDEVIHGIAARLDQIMA